MSVYQDILDWSRNKQAFVQDALRRLITSTTLTQNDIEELVLLVKKECGDTTISLNPIPLDNTHIPTTIAVNGNYPKLISLANPVNIGALHNQGCLQFRNLGLTVVYGDNGSGKSSYSRILKKFCWSRNPSVELKKNVFIPSTEQQQVEFVLENNGSSVSYTLREDSPSNPILSSIFVFDNDCGDIYINNENPTQYKPVGIDILEKLISTFNSITQVFSSYIDSYNTKKPILPQNLLQTRISLWYGSIETLQREEIDSQISFTQIDTERKDGLIKLTDTQNPEQNITKLRNQRARINDNLQQIERIETLFNEQNINEIRANRATLESVEQAYQITTTELQDINTLEGFGTDAWRTL